MNVSAIAVVKQDQDISIGVIGFKSVVVGSNPTGATIHNKGLANKPANPLSFAFELGQVMGQVSFFPSDSDG